MRLILLFLFCAVPLFAEDAQEPKSSSIAILPRGVTHSGDFFASKQSVEVSGTVLGDVYAVGGQIIIDGRVTGDVLVAGGNVEIAGEVEGNVRAIAGQVAITGVVKRNVTAVCGSLQFPSNAKILGNLVCIAGSAELSGSIGSNATALVSNLRISGQIGNDVTAYVGQLRITSKADVGGSVEYSSDKPLSLDDLAHIGGVVTHHPSLIKNVLRGRWIEAFVIGSKVAAVLMNFLFSFVVGWIMIRLYPKNLEGALRAMSHEPLKSLAFGLMLMILLPLASLLLLMTILGVPFALALIALNVISFYSAKTLPIIWVSNKIFTKIGLKENRLSTYSLGLVAYFLLVEIPFFGWLLAIAAVLFGLGSAALSRSQKRFFQ